MTKLDAQSKHGVLIGWFYLIGSIIFEISPILMAIRYINADEHNKPPGETFRYILPILGYLFMATISGLLIWGVVKKRPFLIAPWLACTTIDFIGSVVFMVAQCFSESSLLYVLKHEIFLIGMKFLVIYPIYNLYFNIREFNKNGGNLINGHNDSVETPQKKENNDVLTRNLLSSDGNQIL